MDDNKRHSTVNDGEIVRAGESGIVIPKPIVFSTLDPLGRSVVLKGSTWNIHVIDGDNYRPEFLGEEDTVQAIIEDPKIIVKDPKPNRERYYDLVYLQGIDKIKPMMVVVEHSKQVSDVCTVFLKSTIKDTSEGGIVYVRPRK